MGIGGRVNRESPIDRMKAPRVPKPIPHTVRMEALPTLLAACGEVRDKLILSLLADTGVSRSELAAILIKGQRHQLSNHQDMGQRS